MAYIVPRTLVRQEFAGAASTNIRDRNAHIAGGHAYLSRFSVASEKELSYVGYYDWLDEACVAWPNKPADAVVDLDYTSVWIEDALLKYHQDLVGSGGTVSTVAGYRNRVISSAVNYKDNGDDYPRDEDLLRDVKVGDIVKARYVDGDEFLKWTYVRDILPTMVSAVVGSAASDAANKSTQSASSSYDQVDGSENCVYIDATDHSTYNGVATGDITETYTVVVVEGSTDGDLTTARLRVISASGRDDVASVTPEAAGDATAIGTRGLTVTWDVDTGACESESEAGDYSANDFLVGQRWEIEVNQAFTAPTATAAGTYSGTTDTSYIVTVTRGGKYASGDKPQITVTTADGTDISGPTNVNATATAVAVGSKGVTIAFSQAALSKGDVYTVAVTAETPGNYRTLVLGHNLDSSIPDGSDIDLTLYIKKTVELTENRLDSPPLVNWEADTDSLCLQDGATAYDASWVDGDGEQVALPIESDSDKGYGKVYVEYRAWRALLSGETNSTTDSGTLSVDISGPLVPDNPLKWGVYRAVINSNGTPVRYTAVEDPDSADSWLEVVDVLVGRDDVYGLVPLTRLNTVLDAYVGHVDAQSTPENGRWRMTWVNLESAAEITLASAANSTDDEEILATITEDTDNEQAGAQYTLLQIESDNIDLVTLGIRGGDLVKAQFTTDGFGTVTSTTYVVNRVINSDTLILDAGPDAAINTASKIEICRNQSATARAETLAASAGTFGNRRVCAVWPDKITSGGVEEEGYFLCAALAGLVSGVVPHQSLTRLELTGFDSVPRTTTLFNETQLDVMAEGGVFIVTQDRKSGRIFSRHAVTTGDTDVVSDREEMVVRNVDSISYSFADAYEPYIGIANVTPSQLDILEAETLARIQFLRQANFTPRLGGQLIDATITELRQSPVFKDRVVIGLSLNIPYPLNNIDLTLVVN